jgi:GntR family transcriptional regulator
MSDVSRQTKPTLILQLARELESRVLSGYYAMGQQLPSEPELAAELGVSRTTLREAVARLEARGLLAREHGRGTYVANSGGVSITALLEANMSITDMIESMGLRPGTTGVTAGFEAAPPEAARALGLHERDAALVVRRLRTADGRPVVYSIDYLPQWIPDLPQDASAYGGSLYELLAKCCEAPVASALAQIEPLKASGQVAERLELDAEQLVLALHQTHRLADERAVLYSIDYLRSDVFTVYVRREIPTDPTPHPHGDTT